MGGDNGRSSSPTPLHIDAECLRRRGALDGERAWRGDPFEQFRDLTLHRVTYCLRRIHFGLPPVSIVAVFGGDWGRSTWSSGVRIVNPGRAVLCPLPGIPSGDCYPRAVLREI